MEIIQRIVLETLEKDSLIPDTRAFGSEFSQQQVIGVLMRLESHQVSRKSLKFHLIVPIYRWLNSRLMKKKSGP